MPNKANQIVPPGNNETLKVMFDVMHSLWQGLAIGYMMTAMMWTQHMYSFAHLGRVSWSDTDLMNTASSGMVSGGLSWEENQINVYNSVKWFDVWELPVHTCRRRRWPRQSHPQQTPVRQSMSDICETVSEYVEKRWKQPTMEIGGAMSEHEGKFKFSNLWNWHSLFLLYPSQMFT